MAKDPRTKMIDFFNSKASKKYTEISRKLIREVQSGFKNLGKAEELSLEWKNVIAENSKVFPPGYQRFSRKTAPYQTHQGFMHGFSRILSQVYQSRDA